MSEEWEELLTFDDQPSAEALAELLRNEGVPANVEVVSPVPGLVENIRLVVASSLAHRARWLIESQKLTDRELDFAATGELSPDRDAGG